MTGPASRLDRRRVTALSFGALGAYAYCLYALGPALALLRADLHVSYTLLSLHTSLWAVGTIVTGLSYDRLTRRNGRHLVFWASAAGTVVGALLFVAGYAVGVTLLAAAVLGTAGSFLQTGTVAVLADAYGDEADRALMGANVVASGTAVLAPLVLGGLAGTVLGWRVGMLVAVGTLVVMWARYGRVRLPESVGTGDAVQASLPPTYWVCAALVAVVVGVEFCIVFHGAGLLHDHDGLPADDAATAMGLFYLAELVGRVGGSRLTRRPGRAPSLTAAALVVTAAGFTVFWLSTTAVPALAGLAVAGVGVANLYPLTLAIAVRSAPQSTDAAAARTQLAVGAAVLIAPLALGALADQVGVLRAYAVEPALLVSAAVLLAAVRRSVRVPGGGEAAGGAPVSA